MQDVIVLWNIIWLNKAQLTSVSLFQGRPADQSQQKDHDTDNRHCHQDVIGFEIGKDKFSFGANAMLPINQNLSGGSVDAKYRWSVNFNYAL